MTDDDDQGHQQHVCHQAPAPLRLTGWLLTTALCSSRVTCAASCCGGVVRSKAELQVRHGESPNDSAFCHVVADIQKVCFHVHASDTS